MLTLLLYKADISGGWSSLWNPASEKEGEHGSLDPIDSVATEIMLRHKLAHRDPGGVVTLSILRCRKITVAAVNGHAVCF
jgi:hypothetical protein